MFVRRQVPPDPSAYRNRRRYRRAVVLAFALACATHSSAASWGNDPCRSREVNTVITQTIGYPDSEQLKGKKFFVGPVHPNAAPEAVFFRDAAAAFFAPNAAPTRDKSDFHVVATAEHLPWGGTKYAFPSARARFAYTVALCPNEPVTTVLGPALKCFWKYFETEDLCPFSPSLSQTVLRQALVREAGSPRSRTSATITTAKKLSTK
jgi:hypothetical protein